MDQQKIEAIDHFYIISKEFDKIISLSENLLKDCEDESSIENIKQFIKDFSNNIDDITKIYTLSEQKVVEYLKLEKDCDYMSIESLSTKEKEIDSTLKYPIQKDYEVPLSQAGASSSKEISLRPHTDKVDKKILKNDPFYIEKEILRVHIEKMIELYQLQDSDNKIVDKTGIYSRIHFLKGSDPVEVRDWCDFGSIASIYLTTPNFPKIKRLPNSVKEGIQDTYINNPGISHNDSLAFDFFSAAPDFDSENDCVNKYPVYHFIKIRKLLIEKISVKEEAKNLKDYNENNIHYRRGLRLLIVHRQMNMALKKPFRMYEKPDLYSSVMISANVRATPEAAKRFLEKKIKIIEDGQLGSSQAAKDYLQK